MHSKRMAKVDITALRARLGDISQEELGRRVGGVSQSTISRLESQPQPVDVEGPLGILLSQMANDAPALARAG